MVPAHQHRRDPVRCSMGQDARSMLTAGILSGLLGCTVTPDASPRCKKSRLHEFGGTGDLRNLCRPDARIVIGKIQSQESRLTEPGGRIVTDLHLELSHVIAGPGAPGDELLLTRAGGSYGGVSVGVADTTQLSGQGAHLLFLQDREPGAQPWLMGTALIPWDQFDGLPPAATLTERWTQLCAANPEGIHTDDVPWPRMLAPQCQGSVH